ncbi:Por secretion system C-terminal sorting domain-containing protein [Catalinimonas alkaloidigena]|uniref:Por secretion system C-terminal sorting domain-containing protein n=1 Tax=Catalinimonas alkaloidigena TaxID=1075417 RepID=A0A1G9NYZ5_9BACT|nr:T9SS type A sorting domain-containing protein [Catalinimonas alkaloidigena]SDL91195.1 Por secretion system C-terminal sorting domain-containing protein [Catalinimonas alkaloidigena]
MAILLAGLGLLTSPAAQATVFYVNAAATGANTGASWTDAYTDLQSALSTAISGDQIWVAAGVYTPSALIDLDDSGGSDPREATFRIPTGVRVYGGFAGGEVAVEARDWTTHLTILSGDLDHNDVDLDGNAIAETVADVVGSNAYHVIFTKNVGPGAWLDGCVVTAGRADIAGLSTNKNRDGGGWYNEAKEPAASSSPTIQHCLFQGNYAEDEGGALYNTPGPGGATASPMLLDCTFEANYAGRQGGAMVLGSFTAGTYEADIDHCRFIGNIAYRSGGALYLLGDASTLDSCTFDGNATTIVMPGSTSPGSGGAVNLVASNATFQHCMFLNNSATGTPNGAYEGGGGGAVNIVAGSVSQQSAPSFFSCGFYGNYAGGNTSGWGGAVKQLVDGGVLISQFVNCVFADNSAQEDGGAVALFARDFAYPGPSDAVLESTFTNCTFAGNHADRNGGGYFTNLVYGDVSLLQAKMENCILASNTATTSGDESYNNLSTNTRVSYSLIQGYGGSGGGWNTLAGTDDGNNLDAPPQFVNVALPLGADGLPATSDDGLRLQIGSAARNAGNNAATGLSGVTLDYIGATRIQNGTVDLGAYERFSFIIPGLKLYWLYNWRPYLPNCLTCPWALRFNTRILYAQQLQSREKGGKTDEGTGLVWDAPAQLQVYDDYALVKGTLVHPENKEIRFDVYLKLIKPHTWKAWRTKGRGYKAVTDEAKKAARAHHEEWTYWILSNESKLTGQGALKGTLSLAHAPRNVRTGFQLGEGGNAYDATFGLGGDFTYKGKLYYQRKKLLLKGTGSLNVDAELCTEQCEPTREQATTRPATTTASVSSAEAPYNIYPVPARDRLVLEPAGTASGRHVVRLYDLRGQLLREKAVSVTEGTQHLDLQGLAPGFYQLQLEKPDGSFHRYKIVVQ